MIRVTRLSVAWTSLVGLNLLATVACSSGGADGTPRTPQISTTNQAGGGPGAVSLGGMPGLGGGGSGALGSGGKASLGSGGTLSAGGSMALGSGGVVASGFGGNPSSGGTGNALTTGGSGGNSTQTSQLNGFRVELPCIPVFYEPQSCETLPEVASQQHVLKFGGNPGTVYEVTLRVRGLVEPSSYPGGVVDGSFVVGGAPVPESHVLTLQLGVAAPKQDYFFNNHDYIGDEVYKIDYNAVVMIEGGSMLTFTAVDANADQPKNYHEYVVAGVAPAPLPFDGEFIQFNVVSVNPPL